jgi:hypothetical protein
MPLVLNGTTGVQDNSGAFVAGTAVASTSGTSIDFTSIPSWVKRVTVMFQGISTNGTSPIVVRLGTSGGIVSTGYLFGGGYTTNNSVSGNYSATDGFSIATFAATAALLYSGSITITNISSNSWVSTSILCASTNVMSAYTGGSLTLGGVLDRVRITTTGGTDTFDAGTINIQYEG